MNLAALRRTLVALVASLMLVLPTVGQAAGVETDRAPSALRMTGDLLIARPLMLGATLAGTAVFILGFPFHVAGDNTEYAGRTLVIEPLKNTFFRCLGCIERLPDGHPNYGGAGR